MVEIFDYRSLPNLVTKVEMKNKNFLLLLRYFEEMARKANVV